MNFFRSNARASSFSCSTWERLLFSARFYVGLIFLTLFTFTVHAGAPDPDLDAANRAFTAGDYDTAAKLFQQIIATRGYSAAVCFDLANAESKAGRTGDAILNYERARYLAPGDRDININLQAARKKAGLDPNPYRWWQIVLRSIDWTVWLGVIGVILVLIFIAIIGTSYAPALSSALRIPERPLKNTFRLIFFVGIPLCFLMGFVELSTIGFNDRIEGVIVAPKSATLRLSPFASADVTGTIPEGELVTVENRHDTYLWIEARDHHFGWIEEHDIEPVAGAFEAKP
jgi:tetratricopeptide (TPR) repeat protein